MNKKTITTASGASRHVPSGQSEERGARRKRGRAPPETSVTHVSVASAGIRRAKRQEPVEPRAWIAERQGGAQRPLKGARR
eukprot:3552911-Pyramimonas_sp.AAC.1